MFVACVSLFLCKKNQLKPNFINAKIKFLRFFCKLHRLKNSDYIITSLYIYL